MGSEFIIFNRFIIFKVLSLITINAFFFPKYGKDDEINTDKREICPGNCVEKIIIIK